ncbi:MAG: histidinol-phosphate transaminase [Oscillospiraceae bacterium]|nr:histidinol-phosphate transaminase [Oscillospiraceae bacterium]
MSRFLSSKYASLVPYTPGEQPKILNVTKLNTNECPFPPSEKALAWAAAHTRPLNLYPELLCGDLRAKLGALYGLGAENIVLGNGSDELLYFVFLAYCDAQHGAAFPSISYGFYPVYAAFTGIPCLEVPLREDFSVAPEDYFGLGRTIVIANPNAPTGICLTPAEVETILQKNPDSVVVIDEAYIDFGGETCMPLIGKYDNLLVIQTFSKSRSMAGARLGFAAGNPALIADLNAVIFSINPYNINSMTLALGLGVLEDEETTRKNCRTIMDNRAYTVAELKKLGFTVLPSCANFVFAASDRIGGKELYLQLKERGVLIRHFDKDGISNFNRITIGTREQMDILLQNIREILEEGV